MFCFLNGDFGFIRGCNLLVFFLGVQTPNCIRQTVFDGVSLNYKSITVIVDATAAATADVHAGMCFLC